MAAPAERRRHRATRPPREGSFLRHLRAALAGHSPGERRRSAPLLQRRVRRALCARRSPGLLSRVPYRALVCDLAGTLLLQPPDLDPDLVAGCRRAVSRGLIFCVATGRMPPGAESYLAELDASGPGIFYNGAIVRDSEDGRDLLSLTLPSGIIWWVHVIFAHASVKQRFCRSVNLEVR